MTLPAIHIVSDSVGVTGQAIARAAAAQFGETEPALEVLPNVETIDEARAWLEEHSARALAQTGSPRVIVFYTVVSLDLRHALHAYFREHDEYAAVDLMTDSLTAIAEVSNQKPQAKPGELHVVDENYMRRIDAMEFAISHDDGRNPQDLAKADLVLLGVSRCGKTPTSIYLSQEGLRVANVPLDPKSDPPKEIFEVDPTRLFGLMTTVDVLVDVRSRRLGRGRVANVAASYADPEEVACDLERARALMRKLGCIVIHTEKRAVEETAQEILRYYEIAHPRTTSTKRK